MAWTTNAGLAAQALYEGQVYGTVKEAVSRYAEDAIRAGLVVQRGTAADQVAALAALPAADPDGILAGPFLPVVAGQLLIDVAGAPGGVLDGVGFGPARVTPPRTMTATFDNNVNWGLAALGGTWCYFLGMLNGRIIREDFFLPAGGNVVVTSEQVFDIPIALYIGACDGAGGGAGTWGWSVARVALARGEYGIAAYDLATTPSATATVTYDATDQVPVILDGTVAVVNEATNAAAAVIGDPVMVRVVLAGLDVRGQLAPATSPLNGNFALLEGAQWLTATAAGEIGLVRIGG